MPENELKQIAAGIEEAQVHRVVHCFLCNCAPNLLNYPAASSGVSNGIFIIAPRGG